MHEQTESTIYLIQHPETEWNVRDILQGHLDSPLTEKGRTDARRYAKILASKGIGAIYSSDLGRCQETSEIISKRLGNIPLYFTPELREQNFGQLNGCPNREVAKTIDLHNPNAIPPGGESFTAMTQRVVQYLEKLCGSADGPFLIVTHDGPRRAIEQSPFSSRITTLVLS